MSDKMPIVLHLFPEFKRGGAQINVLRFIRATAGEFEHHVAASPFDRELQDEYEKNGVEVHPIDMTSVKIRSIRLLIRLIRMLKPDIVHVNGKGAAFYGYVSSFFTGFRYGMYHTMRGFHIKYSGWKLKAYLAFERAVAGRMKGTVLVSPSERDFLNETIPGLDQSRLYLIPNGIDVRDCPLPVEIASVVERFDENIVTLSRLSPQKDLITMIDAFSLCADKRKGTALHIMGGETPQDREYAESVRRHLKDAGHSDRVFLWGSVKDAGSLIRYFNLYWTTALFEGLPTAVVEAALCRVLTVGTDCVGNRDLILPGKTGILTEIGDVPGIADALEVALQIRKTSEGTAMIDEAEKLCREFSLENNARLVKKMYLSSL